MVGLDQYGTGPFDQQQFGTAGAEGFNLLCVAFYLRWRRYSYKLVKMLSVCVSVCLDVNMGGTSRNRCTQRLVIWHAQTY